MKYWIVGDEFLDNEAKKEADAQGYLRELVCCKDCKYCKVWQIGYTHPLYECDIIGRIRYADDYCESGVRKEE